MTYTLCRYIRRKGGEGGITTIEAGPEDGSRGTENKDGGWMVFDSHAVSTRRRDRALVARQLAAEGRERRIRRRQPDDEVEAANGG